MQFDTTNSGFDTLLAVYTGTSVGKLKVIANNDDANGGTTSMLSPFNVVKGTTYYIAVDGKNTGTGAAQGSRPRR